MNALILLPKVSNTDSIELFRPIVLDNVKFKIIYKVVAYRLSLIMPTIISKDHKCII